MSGALPRGARREAPGTTTIWLARHGEVHNPREVMYGRLPRWRLSKEGERQAAAVGRFLADRALAAVYTSPLLRARKTAEAIQGHHREVRVRTDRGLMELQTGWQGRSYADLQAIGWDFYANRQASEDDTLESIRARMRGWLRRVLRRHWGQEVAGVSHGDPILIALADLAGAPLQLDQIRPAPYIPTACVFRLRFDEHGGFVNSVMFVPHAREAAAA